MANAVQCKRHVQNILMPPCLHHQTVSSARAMLSGPPDRATAGRKRPGTRPAAVMLSANIVQIDMPTYTTCAGPLELHEPNRRTC
jgi:hypothetical protein